MRTAPAQTYGDATAQADAQRAVPLPQMPGPSAQPPMRPTDRPGEPLTAGMPTGPGAGPSMTAPALDPLRETLAAAYRKFPSPELGAMIEGLNR